LFELLWNKETTKVANLKSPFNLTLINVKIKEKCYPEAVKIILFVQTTGRQTPTNGS